MQEKVVEFSDKQNRKIVGSLIIPEGQGPYPAVVVLHGFKGSRNQTHIKQIAESISEKNIVTLRFDVTSDMGESSLPFEDFTISYELEVLSQAINFLKTLPEVNAEKIGLTGHSLGGLAVAWFAANNPEIKSLATLSAVYSFSDTWGRNHAKEIVEMQKNGFAYYFSNTTQKKYKLNKGFYDDGLIYNMDRVIENINCPVLVLQGTADESVTWEAAQHYFDRVPVQTKQLKIVNHANHNYSVSQTLDEVKQTVAEWFAKTLY